MTGHGRLRELGPLAWSQQLAEARAAGTKIGLLVLVGLDRSITEFHSRLGFEPGRDAFLVLPLDEARRLFERIGPPGLGRVVDGEPLPFAITVARDEASGAITTEASAFTFPGRSN